MKGKLYVMGAPMNIFRRLKPDLQERMVYIPAFMEFPKDKFRQITRFLIAGRIPLPKNVLSLWFDRNALDLLQHACKNDSILLYECTNTKSLRALRHILPEDVDCHIYYCNPIPGIFRHPERDLRKIREMGYKLSCFDPYDAEKYHIDYTGQYFCYPGQPLPLRTTSDFFFCGLPKDRSDILSGIRQLMEAKGYKCDFIIPVHADEKITYSEYLRRLSMTRCVIDIPQHNQRGLTRRPLEALFYDKKLITSNEKITEYDFYYPENIFIFGKDPIDTLNDFMQRPMRKISSDIKDKYDINLWISQFLNENTLP